MDIQIGQYAFPRLVGETLTAQSARIDTVSGATYTSGGYISRCRARLTARPDGGAACYRISLRSRFPGGHRASAARRAGDGDGGLVRRAGRGARGRVAGRRDPLAALGGPRLLALPARQRRRLLAAAEITVDGCADEVAEVITACAALRVCSGGYFSAAPDGVFDPSGYVKGWAVERCAEILSRAGSASHLVNGGGDVQCAGGRPGSGEPWRVGIADPGRPGRLALVSRRPTAPSRPRASPSAARTSSTRSPAAPPAAWPASPSSARRWPWPTRSRPPPSPWARRSPATGPSPWTATRPTRSRRTAKPGRPAASRPHVAAE